MESLEVKRSDGRYYVHASMLLDAPISEVFVALTDYDRFHEFSDRYEEIGFVESAPDGAMRVYSKAKGCIWVFCRTVERYARLELIPDTTIIATVEPGISDLEFGVETWELESLGSQTRVVYHHEAKPKFWIPPLIGTWAMRRTLQKDALAASRGIEQLALEYKQSAE